jgi:hypothetical protein
VNSNVSMVRYCELKGVPGVPWMHHDWNEAIGYMHLDPIGYWPRRKGPFKNNDTTRPTKQDSLSDLKKKAPRVDKHGSLANSGSAKGLSESQHHNLHACTSFESEHYMSALSLGIQEDAPIG